MKNIIFLLSVSICFMNSLHAQYGVWNAIYNYQDNGINGYNFIFITEFSLGSDFSCPTFKTPNIIAENDTLFVKSYFDIRGAWQTSFCFTIDSVSYLEDISPSIRYIKMSTNIITYGGTAQDSLLVENVRFKVFDLLLFSEEPGNVKNSIVVYPNPTQGLISIDDSVDFERMTVVNSVGQIVQDFASSSTGFYDLGNLQNGFYYIEFYGWRRERVGVSRLVKTE